MTDMERLKAMADFIDWADAEWGHPTDEDRAAAERIIAERGR